MCFEKFWAIYPSRHPHSNPKKTAEKAYIKAAKKYDAEQILEGAKNYADYVESHKVERKFICQGATFLNQERFLDYQNATEKPLRMQDIL
tara:strand:+ start:180 stop:449 length:270 start_codon:yes stop_codon:yes gene_type:complete